MAAVLFLFVDGIGLAPPGSSNPLTSESTPFLHRLLGTPLCAPLAPRDEPVLVRSLDASLGHPGLPQSATGQATLLTGKNCADAMGGHYGPWPGPTLRKVLEDGNLFGWAAATEGGARIANAYPPGYFRALEEGRARVNVPVQAALSAGLALPGLAEYSRGQAVPADLTGAHYASIDEGMPTYTPRQAGAVLGRLAADASFTFFDFWLSDRVGHRGSLDEAVSLVKDLDSFIEGAMEALGGTTLVLTSDHGNLEDKGTRGHTRSPVPLLVAGPDRAAFAACRSILDVAPAVRRLIEAP